MAILRIFLRCVSSNSSNSDTFITLSKFISIRFCLLNLIANSWCLCIYGLKWSSFRNEFLFNFSTLDTLWPRITFDFHALTILSYLKFLKNLIGLIFSKHLFWKMKSSIFMTLTGYPSSIQVKPCPDAITYLVTKGSRGITTSLNKSFRSGC